MKKLTVVGLEARDYRLRGDVVLRIKYEKTRCCYTTLELFVDELYSKIIDTNHLSTFAIIENYKNIAQ